MTPTQKPTTQFLRLRLAAGYDVQAAAAAILARINARLTP